MSKKRDKNKAARKKKNKAIKFERRITKPWYPSEKTDSNGNKIKLTWS